MEAGRISNISIVQPATLDIEPVRPRVLINFAFGLLLAVAAGIGTALLTERLQLRSEPLSAPPPWPSGPSGVPSNGAEPLALKSR
jgi:hypothetical protein